MKLKCSDFDLKVLVGPDKKAYHYHKVILASYSEFIDTMLVTDMKEKETQTINFDDIEPEVWEKTIRFCSRVAVA